MAWYWKAMLTALSVVVLTKLGQRAGRRVAGIVAALPTSTAPSLLWLADEHGSAFAAQSAVASVGACAMLAAFALAYAHAARRRGALATLGIALAACAIGALPAMAASGGLVPSAGLALATVAIATRALPRGLPEAPGAAPVPASVCGLLSGAVAALASAASPALGSLGSGMVASMPVTGAALAANAHLALGPGGAQRFLGGYVRGLLGRAAFGAVFALGVSPCGAWMAAGLACLVAMALAMIRLFVWTLVGDGDGRSKHPIARLAQQPPVSDLAQFGPEHCNRAVESLAIAPACARDQPSDASHPGHRDCPAMHAGTDVRIFGRSRSMK